MTVFATARLPDGFDGAQIEMLCDAVGIDYFKGLLQTFYRHTGKTLHELDEAVGAGRPEAVRSLCHSLKASAQQMGCQHLADQIEGVGAAVKAGDFEVAATCLASAHEQFRRAREVLTELGERL